MNIGISELGSEVRAHIETVNSGGRVVRHVGELNPIRLQSVPGVQQLQLLCSIFQR